MTCLISKKNKLLSLLILLSLSEIYCRETVNTILVLATGKASSPWVREVERGLETALTDLTPIKPVLHIESLDADVFKMEEQFEIMEKFLVSKYETTPPDVIITAGLTAWKFLYEHQNIFPSSYKIAIKGVKKDPEFFHDILFPIHLYDKMLEEALRISGSEQIILLGSRVHSGASWHLDTVIENAVGNSEITTVLDFKSFDSLVLKLRQIPEDTALFCLPFGLHVDGRQLKPSEVIDFIVRNSKSPVFFESDTSLGSGIAGGLMTSPFLLGKAAAQKAVNQDSDSSDDETGFSYMYDYAVMKEWDITDRIRPETIVINRKLNLSNTLIYSFTAGTILIFIILFGLLVIKKKTIVSEKAENVESNPFSELSEREFQVLKYLIKGDTLKSIAYEMKISDRTVSTYKKRIFNKLDIKTQAELFNVTSLHSKWLV